MHVITLKHTIYVSVSQGDIRTKFTWQKFNKNVLETDLLNLSYCTTATLCWHVYSFIYLLSYTKLTYYKIGRILLLGIYFHFHL